MSVRSRLLAMLAVLLLALSASGLAIAQSGGPDPNAPVQPRTPTPRGGTEGTPSFSNEKPMPPATPESDELSTPAGAATPLAMGEAYPLAAMTLDSTTIPEDYALIAESYTTPQEMADNLAGQVSADQLLATGLESMYTSYYINKDGNTVRTYVIAYDTVAGVQKGFDILENEELLVPNGSMTDTPAPAGLGESPSEITSGFIENGDGTQTHTYDVSFRIDRYEVGAAMETFDGSDPDADLVDQMARDVSDRVNAVLAGEDVSGVDYSLPDALLEVDAPVAFEGFETASEAFLIDNPADTPDGYLGGYFRGVSYSRNVTSALPIVTLGITTFESGADVASALDDSESIMPSYPDLEQLRRIRVDGADDAIAFSYSAPSGAGQPDSVRVFAQVDDQLVIIDVQGMDSVDDAESAATDLAEAEIACAVDGDCSDPGVMSGQ